MVKQLARLLFIGAIAAPAMAQQCAVTVESTDSMQYNTGSIEISKKCKEFVITLKHVGKLFPGHSALMKGSMKLTG